MLKYFLKYWVGGVIFLFLVVYLISLVFSYLPKVILSILALALLIWFVKTIVQLFRAEYRHYIEYEKPRNEAMKMFRKEVWQHMKAELRTAWTDYRKSRQS
ncbi:MAG: hypothetical protein Q8Q89_03910 [bacterium]|nr:hypothetical protein [bacterium]